MKKVLISLFLILFLVACSNERIDDGKIHVVSSFSIITDMVEEIGQELVSVHNLVPIGTDPHEYEVKPNDLMAISDADILFYNGLNLEGGEFGWFIKTMRALGIDENLIYNLGENIEPMYLLDDKDHHDQINPHAFLNPKVGIKMSESVLEALISIDPDNKEIYRENAKSYISKLSDLDNYYAEVISNIPEENKLFVTSERAFQYMNSEYGLREAYIWEIDTEELGTTNQLKALIDYLEIDRPPYLFLESNVDPKPLETVSKESNIPIFETRVFSDEIGQKGSSGDTYLKMLEHNIEAIKAGLSK